MSGIFNGKTLIAGSFNNKELAAVYVGDREVFVNKRYLTFKSTDNNTLGINNVGGNNPLFYYSYNKRDWIEWDYSDLPFDKNTPLYLKGVNSQLNKSDNKYSSFVINGEGKVNCSGNIMHLTNEHPLDGTANYAFYKLFMGCDKLVSAPKLPATNVGYYAYLSMFQNCTSLITAPELPGRNLGVMCYSGMFSGCTSLTNIPFVIKYTGTETHRLMFKDCISLTRAPDILTTNITAGWAHGIFWGCTNLKYVKCLSNVKSEGVLYWMRNVPAGGTFVKHPDVTWPSGENGIPSGWTVIDAEI